MHWEELPVGTPGPGEVRIRHTAVGLNFIDVYVRSGLYPALQLPGSIGMEGAGVVKEVGPDVDGLSVGDRIAYAAQPPGAYAEERLIAASKAVTLPDDIDDRTAGAAMLKGMTAEYLVYRTHCLRPGETALIHAAAGGVGLLLCAWARHIGARVIGTVGSDEKARLASEHGCEHPIVYSRENFVERVKELTDGRGADVVYDSVGQATFDGSMEALAIRGHLVSFGQASGPVPALEISRLAAKSATLSRPSLFHYTASAAELQAIAGNLFDAIRRRIIRVEINQTYPLRDAADAHRDLEARKTTGSTLLIP